MAWAFFLLFVAAVSFPLDVHPSEFKLPANFCQVPGLVKLFEGSVRVWGIGGNGQVLGLSDWQQSVN